MMIPLMVLQVDGVMRVFARTKFLFVLNLARLGIIAGLIQWSLREFHLLGAILVSLLATLVFKAAALMRMRLWMQTTAADLLPWSRLAGIICASLGAALVTLLVKSRMEGSALTILSVAGAVYFIVYSALVWICGLLSFQEREAIAGVVRKSLGIAKILGATES